MEIIGPGVQRKTMTENIKHMREIVEHVKHEMTRQAIAFRIAETTDRGYYTGKSPCPRNEPCCVTERSVTVGDLCNMILALSDLVYHTAPGEMEFGGEGWTWKQQARADHDRLLAVEAERNKAQRDLEAVALRLDELHAKIDALARKPEP